MPSPARRPAQVATTDRHLQLEIPLVDAQEALLEAAAAGDEWLTQAAAADPLEGLT